MPSSNLPYPQRYTTAFLADLICIITGGRQRTDCCLVAKVPVVTNVNCDYTTCDIDPDSCDIDVIDDPDGYAKRDLSATGQSSLDGTDLWLEKRGGKRDYKWITVLGSTIYQSSRSYPVPSAYMRNLRNGLSNIATSWWQMRSRTCDDPSVAATDLDTTATSAPAGAQVEHGLPVSLKRAHIIEKRQTNTGIECGSGSIRCCSQPR
jgi:hypothetical protein